MPCICVFAHTALYTTSANSCRALISQMDGFGLGPSILASPDSTSPVHAWLLPLLGLTDERSLEVPRPQTNNLKPRSLPRLAPGPRPLRRILSKESWFPLLIVGRYT